MDVLKMTDPEIYELGIKELTEQLGAAYTKWFLQRCKPRDYDYTAERHKWLADDLDIPTIAKQIQQARAAQEKEEYIKAERAASWRNGLLELTDIEIYELALKILSDRLDGYGLATFIMHHFKVNRTQENHVGIPKTEQARAKENERTRNDR